MLDLISVVIVCCSVFLCVFQRLILALVLIEFP